MVHRNRSCVSSIVVSKLPPLSRDFRLIAGLVPTFVRVANRLFGCRLSIPSGLVSRLYVVFTSYTRMHRIRRNQDSYLLACIKLEEYQRP